MFIEDYHSNADTPVFGAIPNTELLVGITEFADKSDSDEQESSRLVANLISQLSQKGGIQKVTSTMIVNGEGLPSLPKKYVEKILARGSQLA